MPLFLNSNIPNIDQKIKMAIKGKYIYIFLSPKLVNLKALYPLFINPKFKKLLAIIIINKTHLVTYQGQLASIEELVFRKKFLKLENLYSLIRLSVLLFTYLATLNLKTLEDIIRSLIFRDYNIKIIQTAFTWKELAFHLNTILRKIIELYTLLYFFVNATIKPLINKEYLNKLNLEGYTIIPKNIPKTIIFFNIR